jgi:bacilliredoxin
VQETRPPEAVDAILGPHAGPVLMVINSMGGCAAGRARPGMALALRHAWVPAHAATVCAGGALEATARVRESLPADPPSSPAVALFREGKPVFMWQRHQVEQRDATELAKVLTEALNQVCGQQP